MGNEVKRTERGWAGHFICSHFCQFRRNTLLESATDAVIVSSVGNMIGSMSVDRKMEQIGAGRYYETQVFGVAAGGIYKDIDVSDRRSFNLPWAICADSPEALPPDVDNVANAIHESVVNEFIRLLGSGSSKESIN